MNPRSLLFLIALFSLGLSGNAQVLEIEHLKVLVDTVPFKFSGSIDTKNYSRYREIRIGCLNTGNKDLLITGATQSFTNDTSWLKVAENVKYPNTIKPGSYGTISILYSVSSPYHQIKISSNSRTGPQIITLYDTYKDPIEIKRNMSDYPAKMREGIAATFSSLIFNHSSKTVIVDSVVFTDPTLRMVTKLPLYIPAGKSAPLSLIANTSGKMNYYYGGTPLFFYHEENGYENFTRQEFSCIILPNIQLLDADTFNFGKVKRGTEINAVFHYVNKGSFTLEAGKNKNECITFDKPSIAPGETFTVSLKFNTSVTDSGKILREFAFLLPPFVYSNTIFMKGFVSGPSIIKNNLLKTDERVIDCGTVANDTAKSIKRIIRVQNTSGFPITITNVTITEGAYAFSDVKTVIPPGEYFNLKFAYRTKTPGFFNKLIRVSFATGDCTNGEYDYEIEVKGNIVPH